MVSFNSVVMAGNLTRDPELRYTPNGKAVCDLRLAVNHVWKGADGQKKESVCFIDVVLWNRTGEVAAQYLKKGKTVLVHGRLEFQQWVGKDGAKRSKHRLMANGLKFLSTSGGSVPKDEETSTTADAPPDAEVTTEAEEPTPF